MRRIVFRLVFAISAAIALPAQAEVQSGLPAACGQAALAERPMILKSGHVTIPASINGKDVTLGIDTGGPFSSLTLAAAHHIGNVGHRDDLRIGDLALNRTYMGWMDAFSGVDGLIAPDVLARYDVEFDFGAGMFRLFRAHACAERVREMGSVVVIPFTLTADGHVRVPVTLDGRTVYAILDTGSPISVLAMQDANRMFGLDPDSAGIKPANMVSGLWSNRSLAAYTFGIWDTPSKRVRAYSYPFKTLSLGGLTLADPAIEVTEGRNFLGRDHASLLLGNDVLSHFHFIIAYREQKLYLGEAGAH